jgi:four helix bundle protein
MLQNFRSYQLAVQLHKECKARALPYYLKDQLLRASSSIALNLSEGGARSTSKDRKRFYVIVFASLREVQALIDLEDILETLRSQADSLGAQFFWAIEQTGVVLTIGGAVYGFHCLLSKNRLSGDSFLNYLGLRAAPDQFDRRFWMIFCAVAFHGVASTVVGCHFDGMRQMMTGKSSPYGAILMDGFGFRFHRPWLLWRALV